MLLRLFLEAGSDAGAEDALGKTSLHIAGQHGHMRIARVLLAAGGNKEGKDSAGRTPWQLARENGQIMELLLQKVVVFHLNSPVVRRLVGHSGR